ncbi:MAG: hypothetical protein GF355_09485 [Candidatus Eisenbacteria bacterium]|nr:hypothetical protein [Candidatus Eisenbacteria bacterium]
MTDQSERCWFVMAHYFAKELLQANEDLSRCEHVGLDYYGGVSTAEALDRAQEFLSADARPRGWDDAQADPIGDIMRIIRWVEGGARS